ncbi:hypothetical protein B296_00058935 [Ensete ventricosum]|uniref:Uncharacterized protein n=1 Tax=Ensete ventricosum TaxID=4639 RepID=A0A426WXS3_ENSVE|nr:hypothetical protein B296_00058935 [Ensete ventricosum]
MTPKTPIREFPYSLAFGIEVVLPPEVIFPTLRIEHFEQEASGLGLKENVDLIEELRAKAHQRALTYQKVIARLYNRRVRPQLVGDDSLVLSDPGHTRGKLAPNWEGLYQVIHTIREGTYVPSTMDN